MNFPPDEQRCLDPRDGMQKKSFRGLPNDRVMNVGVLGILAGKLVKLFHHDAQETLVAAKLEIAVTHERNKKGRHAISNHVPPLFYRQTLTQTNHLLQGLNVPWQALGVVLQ